MDTALTIAKKDGWQAVSMRKIATQLKVSATAIYEYFAGKDALLLEIARLGFVRLIIRLEKAVKQSNEPLMQLELIGIAYWDFSKTETTFFKIMFGVDTCHLVKRSELKELQLIRMLIGNVINNLPEKSNLDKLYVINKTQTFIAFIYGMAAIGLTKAPFADETYLHILQETIKIFDPFRSYRYSEPEEYLN